MRERRARFLLGSVAFALLEGATSAQPVTIDFDDTPSGTTINDRFGLATFSSEAGFINVTASDHDLGTSRPNYLCTATAEGSLTCTNNTYVDFAVPVNNLRFLEAGDNAIGVVGRVIVFSLGANAGSVDLQGNGEFTDPFVVDLSSFTNVTRIEIVDITDGGGLAWDDFAFDVTPWEVVPASGSEGGEDRVTLLGPRTDSVAELTVRFGASAASVIGGEPGRIVVATPPGTGVVDVTVSTSAWALTVPHAFTYIDRELATRLGNVGIAAGDRENVLLVNASSGDLLTREIRVAPGARIRLVMLSPSSRPTARFALFAWRHVPDANTLTRLPRSLGWMVFPVPFTGGSPQPTVTWNNAGRSAIFGAPTASSSPAPSLILDAAQGSPNRARVTLQGIIEDDASGIPERVSVTNAVILRVE